MNKKAISKKGNIQKITKRYNIVFSYAGIRQYADFYESEGKLVNPRLSVSYSKAKKVPDVSNMETIDEVLEAIKSFAYGSYVEINLINGQPVNFYNNTKAKEHLSIFNEKFDKFIEDEALHYFKTILEPIMIDNSWFVASSHVGAPVLIEKNEDGEWDNIKRDDKAFDFEYLCFKFANNFRKYLKVYLKCEFNNRSAYSGFMAMFNLVSSDYIAEKGYYLNLEK